MSISALGQRYKEDIIIVRIGKGLVLFTTNKRIEQLRYGVGVSDDEDSCADVFLQETIQKWRICFGIIVLNGESLRLC